MAETLQFIAKAFKAHCCSVLRDLCAICSILLAVQTLLYSPSIRTCVLNRDFVICAGHIVPATFCLRFDL
jgi:hypothetical protein